MFACLALLIGIVLGAPAHAADPVFTKLYDFKVNPEGDGFYPGSRLISDEKAGTPGALYGTVAGGGNRCNYANGTCGAVFKLTPPAAGATKWTETRIYTFVGDEGGAPSGPLVADAKGVLYGTSEYGGNVNSTDCPYGCGSVFSLTPPVKAGGVWAYKGLYLFKGGVDGANPRNAGVALDTSGSLFGVTVQGGNRSCTGGCGIIYGLAPPTEGHAAWSYKRLYSFRGSPDGAAPYSNVIIGRDKVVYGTTLGGGVGGCGGAGCGTVFSLSSPAPGHTVWKKSTIYTFKGTDSEGYPMDGYSPLGELYEGGTGLLYGTTQSGGNRAFNTGTIFRLKPPSTAGRPWGYSQIHVFRETSTMHEGSEPWAGLVTDGAGNFYGTTSNSGTKGAGTIYKLVAPKGGDVWDYSVLYPFSNPHSKQTGQAPRAALTRAPNGTLFGTAHSGGIQDVGVVFQLTGE